MQLRNVLVAQFLLASAMIVPPVPAADGDAATVKDAADLPGGYVVRGVTATTTDGRAGGIRVMHAMCQAEFGPTSRQCRSTEVVESSTTTAVLGSSGDDSFEAWVQPVIASRQVFYDPGADEWLAVVTDSTDLMRTATYSFPEQAIVDSTLSCLGWTVAARGKTGMVFLRSGERGSLVTDSCGDALPVLCCAPADIPTRR